MFLFNSIEIIERLITVIRRDIMKFEKKLIILSGANNAKGTLTLERNAYGTFAQFNIFNLPNAVAGEYAVGIKDGSSVFVRNIGTLGRILARFKINDLDLNSAHCIIFENATESPVLYGTSDAKKLWEGNMMDGIRSKPLEFNLSTQMSQKNFEEALPTYSKPTKEISKSQEIDNYFLDILPKDSAEYMDNAVAQVNYYPSEMKVELKYSDRLEPNPAEILNPIDNEIYKRKKIEALENALDLESATKVENGFVLKQFLSNNERELAHKTDDAQTEEKSVLSEYEKPRNERNMRDGFNEKNAIRKDVNTYAVQANGQDKNNIINNNANAKILQGNQKEAAATIPSLSSYKVENAVRSVKTQAIFYEQLKPQLDSLFKNNPPFEKLQNAMPETKWIKVNYDDNGKYYVVGLIGGKPDYICYGVPANFTLTAPSELDGYCQWLPVDGAKPEGEGFWLMFQDAVTGESIKSIEL